MLQQQADRCPNSPARVKIKQSGAKEPGMWLLVDMILYDALLTSAGNYGSHKTAVQLYFLMPSVFFFFLYLSLSITPATDPNWKWSDQWPSIHDVQVISEGLIGIALCLSVSR